MGVLGHFLYRPDFGAKGQQEYLAFDDSLLKADAEIYAAQIHRLAQSNVHGLVFTGPGSGGGLTKEEILKIEPQLRAPKPVKPPEKLPEKPKPGKLTRFIGSPFFVKTLEPLKTGESAFSRWTQEKAKLSAQADGVSNRGKQ